MKYVDIGTNTQKMIEKSLGGRIDHYVFGRIDLDLWLGFGRRCSSVYKTELIRHLREQE